MIRLRPRVAALQMILPRQFQRRLDGLGTAACEPDSVELTWRLVGDDRRQLFGHFAREESGMSIFQTRCLSRRSPPPPPGVHGRGRILPLRRSVDVAAAVGVDQENAFSANGDGGTRGR